MNSNISNIYNRLQKSDYPNIAYGTVYKNENKVFVQQISSMNVIPLDIAIEYKIPVGYCLFFNTFLDHDNIKLAKNLDIQPILVVNNFPDVRFKKEDFYIFQQNHAQFHKIGYSSLCNDMYKGIEIFTINTPKLDEDQAKLYRSNPKKYDVVIVSEDQNVANTTKDILQQQFPRKHINILHTYQNMTELYQTLSEYHTAIVYNDLIASFNSTILNTITMTNKPCYANATVVNQFQDIINILNNPDLYINQTHLELTTTNFDTSFKNYFNTLT